MYDITLGETIDIATCVSRAWGSGTITVTSPQRRILFDHHVPSTSTCHDWDDATWDATNSVIYASFPTSTGDPRIVPGTYYVELRGVIGTETYKKEITVHVRETS